MTSTDGFCSVVIFEREELGKIYTGPVPPPSAMASSSTSHQASIPNAKSGAASSSSGASLQPQQSPSRTPSASSVSTLSSLTQGAMNQTPTLAPMPSITAFSSSSSISLSTPPQTPHAGSVLGKRDGEAGGVTASVSTDVTPAADQGAKKRRRIAPTPVSSLQSSSMHKE